MKKKKKMKMRGSGGSASVLSPAMAVASAFHIESGTVLGGGRYVVVREINRGGLAVVYEAIDTANEGEGVALKCMDLRPLTSSAAAVTRAHVEREIRNASSFHHRNIINLLNVFADGNHLVIVLELVRGKDLLELINEGGGFLDDAKARRYFKQLLEGVDFLHKKGFAHRDIKPENCMVETRKDRLVIIDFGLSKHLTSAKTLGVGTPDYMVRVSERERYEESHLSVIACVGRALTGCLIYTSLSLSLSLCVCVCVYATLFMRDHVVNLAVFLSHRPPS